MCTYQKPPKKFWLKGLNPIGWPILTIRGWGLCCSGSLGASSLSVSNLVLQHGHWSWSFNHVLRHALSKACPHGNSQLLFPFDPTFSRQMLQSASFPSFIGGRLSRNYSLTPRFCGCSSPSWKAKKLGIDICLNMPSKGSLYPKFILMLFMFPIFTWGSPRAWVKVCTCGSSIPVPYEMVTDRV